MKRSVMFQGNKIFVAMMGLISLMVASQASAQSVIPPDKDSLLKGLGMGLASYAEENNYPGPKHVLDLKEQLALNRDQIKKAETLANLVSVTAVAKGEEIVQAEEELNKMFQEGKINEKSLRAKLEQIGKLRADLRFIHLQAHLKMKQVLTADQIKKYNELRGHEANQQN